MEISNLFFFFLASCLLAVTPGPDNLFVLTHSAMMGMRSAMIVVLGLCTGLIAHTVIVVTGLAALIQSHDYALTIIQYVGVAYLLWLAYQSFKSTLESKCSQTSTAQTSHRVALSSLYVRGIVMNITNPKVGLFFIAFLPQFVSDGGWSFSLQLLTLGGVFIIATLLCFGGIAFLASSLKSIYAHNSQAENWMNRIASLVFVGLAVRLGLTEI